MKKVLIRLLLVEFAALAVAIGINYGNHNTYWKKTIFRTQTVDFNILSHTLPTKLSYALQNNDIEALQQTLNSNYELFGLVVTDCKTERKECQNQKILYLSKVDEKLRPWRQFLKPSDLINQPYSLLRNPPPMYADWYYSSPHSQDTERQVSKKQNQGEIIGRVYYIRGVPPAYLDDVKRWLQNPLMDSGGSRIYLLSFIICILAGFAAWVVIELILYKKVSQEKEFALENERKVAEHDKQLALEASQRLEIEKQFALEANQRLEVESQLAQQQNVLASEEKKRLEAENENIKHKNQLLETENKLARTKGFIGGIQEVIEQDFSSVVNNRLQELESIFRRLNTDIDNITHDLRKAPLIRSVEDIPGKTVERLNCLSYDDTVKDSILHDLTKYLQDADQTIKFISWVIDDLNQVANIESTPVYIQQELDRFSQNMPPNLRKKWLFIEFHKQYEEPLWIQNNPWHLRSIVKNVLYNSTAALMEVYEESNYKFKAKISVTCQKIGDEAAIIIEDNGKGFGEQTLKKLYQAPDKVNSNAGAYQGKGSIIVFSYLSLHGGRAELTNNMEGGARATFLFPLAPPP